VRGRNGLADPDELRCASRLRSPRGAPPGGLLLHGRSLCGLPRGVSFHGRSPRGASPCGFAPHGLRSRGPAGLNAFLASDVSGGFPGVHGRLPPPAGLLLHGRSPRGASPDGLAFHGFRWARGPVGLVCHGRSTGGAPPAGLSFHGLRSRGLAALAPGAAFDRSEGFPVQGRRLPPPDLLFHGRSPRGGPAGLSRHPPPLVLESDEGRRGSRGADDTNPGLSRSRCVAGSFSDHARSGRFFFLNRSRGSLCVPPGRQSLPRRSAPSGRSARRSRGAAAACLRI